MNRQRKSHQQLCHVAHKPMSSRGRYHNADIQPKFLLSTARRDLSASDPLFHSMPKCRASPSLSLQPCSSPFKRSWPAISRDPRSQHLPPLPCCPEHCTPQIPPSWVAGRSRSPCPSSPAGQGPQWLSHPDL